MSVPSAQRDLGDSRLLDRFGIIRFLKYWTFICLLAVILLTSIAVFNLHPLAIIIVGVLVVALIAAGFSVGSKGLKRAFADLKMAMYSFSKGNLSTRLPSRVVGKDEFSDLHFEFNRFVGEVQRLLEKAADEKSSLAKISKKSAAILENACTGIANIQEQKFFSVNKQFETIFGFSRHEVLGMSADLIFPSVASYKNMANAAYALLAEGEVYQGEWELKTKNNTIFWGRISASSVIAGQPESGTIWLYEDITQKKKDERELRLLANYDVLTELPNRSLFHDRLAQTLERALRYNNTFALMFVDLDRFKYVNDTFGHAVGDQLLQAVAKRLLACVRDSDTVSRLSGDEFTVIVLDAGTTITTSKIAEKIIDAMAKPYLLQGQEVEISSSAGISMFPDDATNTEGLIKNADAAMYAAKSKGRNNYQFYAREMNMETEKRLIVETDLRQAVSDQEFKLHYQPQIDVSSREVIGYEALLRWYTPDDNIVYPADFMPVLEDTGLIVELGEWILQTACKETRQLIARHDSLRHICVNLSPGQFAHKSLIAKLKAALEATDLPPKYLMLEVTEAMLTRDLEQSQKILEQLHALGVRLSLDDFGAGYASLTYLDRFPIDTIKIDRAFVAHINSDPSNTKICEAILAIAERLKLKVIAEGVETEAQLRFLSDNRCSVIQGNLFGEPKELGNIITG